MTDPSHPRAIVITGDDFGASGAVNRGIIEAHERGVLTATSLMVTGEAFEEAVALAKSRPRLAVGLHLVVSSERPVLPADQIPHLVGPTGRLSRALVRAGLLYQFSPPARRELRLEIRAQLERFRLTGLRLSHVDGHQHMHLHPVVLSSLVELAPEFGIKVIRLPWEELRIALGIDRSRVLSKAILWFVFGWLRRYGEGRLKSAGIQFATRVYGLLASGQMTEGYLLSLIPQIRADRVEIYSHPTTEAGAEGNHSRGASQAQLTALLSQKVREALAADCFRLVGSLERNGCTAS